MDREKQESWRAEQRIYNVIRFILFKWNWILLAAVVSAVAGDVWMTLSNRPVYRTEASFALNMPAYGTDGNEEGQISEALGYILMSNVFLDKVKQELGTDELAGRFAASAVPGTNIVNIAAEADTPELSYRMMYIMMNQYQELTSLVIGDMNIEILQNVRVPMNPVNPVDHRGNLIKYGAAGGGVMILIVMLLAYFRQTVKDRDAVRELLQIRLLGDVPRESKLTIQRRRLVLKRALLVTQLTTSTAFVETYRRLAERFERECRRHEGRKVIAVSSAWENEGKTSVAVNLALTLVQKGRKVLLVDGDLAKPAVGKIMEVTSEKGLASLLREQDASEISPEIVTKDKVDFLLTERTEDDNRELLENGKLKTVLQFYREVYDYILIDTPPAGLLTDAVIIADYTDAVLMVIRQDYTPVRLISRNIEQYLHQGTPVLGGVVNRSKPVGEKRKKMYETGGGDERKNI